MQKRSDQILMSNYDYNMIMSGLKSNVAKQRFNRHDAEELLDELKKARVVSKDDLPADVVRLNSVVVIKDEAENKVLELTVVMPEKADVKQRKISVFSPIGTALIGYQKGEKIAWVVPAGKETFTLLDVNNPFP